MKGVVKQVSELLLSLKYFLFVIKLPLLLCSREQHLSMETVLLVITMSSQLMGFLSSLFQPQHLLPIEGDSFFYGTMESPNAKTAL